MKKKTIVIVDDHLLFAQSLESLISKLEEYEVLAILKNGKELTQYYKHKRKVPDLILLDVKMPVMDGVQTMQWLKEHRSEQKVLALTMEDDEDTIIKMIRAGAKGYLLKDIHPENFEFAMKMVIEQGFYYSGKIENALRHFEEGGGSVEFHERLTDKERGFLKLACSELTYKDIAGEMGLSPKTIENYRETVFRKLEVKTRVGLVIYCMKNKLFKV
ncbi:DNA-binding response regulator [Aquimarina sp. AD10]|uniref:Two-component system response regulator n=1 Tax=Aquimarina aggregata TaxID=1642818 RepID=A0A162CSW6_9FLAO|nr:MULTISPECIES: response regulator transcription factor [Aquimarina]AXT58870.1 DNA-binding response regulator [Aquimarina sp. AD10]KZS41684.1 two-component system response regulator [Aquimarina aggregata]RKM99655.1 DNA-binding response regulator [Aquimarina sp. AD10]